ncbi:MAG: type II toxin-antitoxin system death-on-curing family toxin [Nitrococcus sp.]|nr:type II toxin-antitoxin system death-on-curing family toxin [Nitrococcus sp.]
MTDAVVWIDARETEFINCQLVAQFGGLAGGVRDRGLLDAAMARPLNQWAYADPAPDVFDLAAAYCFAICKSHAFCDGNKRSAHAVAAVFLENNGYRHQPPQSEVVASMLALAEDQLAEPGLAAWFRETSRALEDR